MIKNNKFMKEIKKNPFLDKIVEKERIKDLQFLFKTFPFLKDRYFQQKLKKSVNKENLKKKERFIKENGKEYFIKYNFKDLKCPEIERIEKESLIIQQAKLELESWENEFKNRTKKDLFFNLKLYSNFKLKKEIKDKWENKIALIKESKNIGIFDYLFFEISSKQEKKTDSEILLYNLFNFLNFDYNKFFILILKETFKDFFLGIEEKEDNFFEKFIQNQKKYLEIDFTKFATQFGNNIVQVLISTYFINPYLIAKKKLNSEEEKESKKTKRKDNNKIICETFEKLIENCNFRKLYSFFSEENNENSKKNSKKNINIFNEEKILQNIFKERLFYLSGEINLLKDFLQKEFPKESLLLKHNLLKKTEMFYKTKAKMLLKEEKANLKKIKISNREKILNSKNFAFFKEEQNKEINKIYKIIKTYLQLSVKNNINIINYGRTKNRNLFINFLVFGLFNEIEVKKISTSFIEEDLRKFFYSKQKELNFLLGSYILQFLSENTQDMFQIKINKIKIENSQKIKLKRIISLDLEFWNFISKKMHKIFHRLPCADYFLGGGKNNKLILGGMYSTLGFKSNFKDLNNDLKLPSFSINFSISEDYLERLLKIINKRQSISYSINNDYFKLIKNIESSLVNIKDDHLYFFNGHPFFIIWKVYQFLFLKLKIF